MEICIRTLGGLQVHVDGLDNARLAEVPTRAALLVFLAVEGEVTRDVVQGTLWSDLPPDRARHALNQALYLLRKDLGDDWIESRGERLRTTDTVRVDAVSFQAAAGDVSRAEAVTRALSLYQGAFLDGWHLRDTPEFEKWTDGVRTRLSRLHRELCRLRLTELRSKGLTEAALALARAWVQRDPLEDEAHHVLLELLGETGHRTEALERYEALKRALASEGLAPLDETRDLVGRIRGNSDPTGTGGGAEPPPDTAPEVPSDGPSVGPEPHRRVAMGTLAIRAFTGVAVVTVLLVLLSQVRVAGPAAAPPLDPNRVLVHPLVNRTGDASLDPVGWMAADWITQGLGRTEFVEVVPSGELFPGPSSSSPGQQPSDPIRAARSAARDSRSGILVTGAYYRSGDGLAFDVQVLGGPEWEVLGTVGPVRTLSRDPMEAVEALRKDVTIEIALHRDERLGGAFTTSQTPPSFESYVAFAEGFRIVARGDFSGAVGPLTRANELSPEFTAPLILAAAASLLDHRYEAADSLLDLVEASRDRLPRYDRLRLDAVRWTLQGDNARAFTAIKAAADLAPGGTAHFGAAVRALGLNRPDEALEILRTWDPTREVARYWAPYWDVVTQAYHIQGQHGRELREAREGRRQLPDRLETLESELRALSALGRVPEVERLLDEALSRTVASGFEMGRVIVSTAEELAAHGAPEEASRVLARFNPWLQGLPPEVRDRRGLRLLLGRVRAEEGRLEEAAEIFAGLHQEAPDDPAPLRFLGTLAARSGEREASEAWYRRLQELDPTYRFGQHTFGRAAIAARLGRREEAVVLLRQAVEQGMSVGTFLHADPDLAALRGFEPFEAFLRPTG